jgi:hypothetical protein
MPYALVLVAAYASVDMASQHLDPFQTHSKRHIFFGLMRVFCMSTGTSMSNIVLNLTQGESTLYWLSCYFSGYVVEHICLLFLTDVLYRS